MHRRTTGIAVTIFIGLVTIVIWRLAVFKSPDSSRADLGSSEVELPRQSPGPSNSSSHSQNAEPEQFLAKRDFILGQPALYAPKPLELSTTDRPPLADRLGAGSTQPAQEPQIVLDLLNAYRRSFGVYPVGENNRQIVNALLGANPQRLPFIPGDHPRINAGGEIVDAWGSPFFFHLISHDSIEIRSAGPDRSMYTADDIIAGSSQPVSSRSESITR